MLGLESSVKHLLPEEKWGTVLCHGERVVVQKWQGLGMLQTTQAGADSVFAHHAGLRTQASVVDQASKLLP